MAPQAGFEPATLRLTEPRQTSCGSSWVRFLAGFLMGSSRALRSASFLTPTPCLIVSHLVKHFTWHVTRRNHRLVPFQELDSVARLFFNARGRKVPSALSDRAFADGPDAASGRRILRSQGRPSLQG